MMPSPDASPEEFEASARRYSDACRIILRLRNGQYALFGNDRNLILIGTLTEVCEHPAITDYVPVAVRKPKAPVTLEYLTDLTIAGETQ